MKSEEIIELANHPDVPKFKFGGPELDAWHRKYQGGFGSPWYVVIHRSWNPLVRDFRVLSCLTYGAITPVSYDVPQTAVQALPA